MIDYRYIEAFLAVVSTNSISKAAEYLYVSQSSISKWLNMLEQEVGTQIVVRRRGHRTIELTTSGKELVPLAEEWLNLHRAITRMGENVRPSLRVASIDSLNATIMLPVYRKLMEHNPNIDIVITSNQSNIIYELVEKRQFDIGFTLSELRIPNLVVTPFLKQKFCMLLYSEKDVDTTRAIKTQDLDPSKELFQPWGLAYQQWHDYWWSNTPHYMKVDTISTMEGLFAKEGLWTIVPDSVAEYFKSRAHIHVLELKSPPPARTCYYIIHKYPRENCKTALKLFEELVVQIGNL